MPLTIVYLTEKYNHAQVEEKFPFCSCPHGNFNSTSSQLRFEGG